MTTTFATATHTGLVRKANEDSLFARPPVFVVADGMGGAKAGEVASHMAVKAFEWFVPQTDSPEDELVRIISRVNASIHDLATTHRSYGGMGTTLTAAVIHGGSVSIGHVGDSRAYLWRDGALSRLTEDHSLVGEMVRSGQLTDKEAEEHPQRSIITRALGVEPEVQIDTSNVQCRAGDVFLLCSDGLSSMIDDSVIAAMLAAGDNLYVTAWHLIEAANDAGGRDNISIVVFCPDGSVESGIEPEPALAAAVAPEPRPGEAGGEEAVADEPPGAVEIARPEGRLGALRWWLGTFPGRVAIGLALAVAILLASWFVTRQVYYLGVQGDQVVIYQGIPYDLGPWSLSTMYRSSPVKYSELQPYEQERVRNQELQTKGNAEKMLENYSGEARQRKQEQQAAQEAARTSTAPTLTVPPGGLP